MIGNTGIKPRGSNLSILNPILLPTAKLSQLRTNYNMWHIGSTLLFFYFAPLAVNPILHEVFDRRILHRERGAKMPLI